MRGPWPPGFKMGCIFEGEIGRDDRHRLLTIVQPELRATQYLAHLPERRELRASQPAWLWPMSSQRAGYSRYENILEPP